MRNKDSAGYRGTLHDSSNRCCVLSFICAVNIAQKIIIVFTSMLSSCLQGRQYPTASPAIQPGVSSFDSNAEQRLKMALVHFRHEYFVVSKQE